MKISVLIAALIFCSMGCHAQKEIKYRQVGGPCEGCDAVFEYEHKILIDTDTIPGFSNGKLKLKLYGTIYKIDGETPAKDIILYFHQTNEDGIYFADESEKGWGLRHGSARNWLKTNEKGQYTLYTFKPGSYPGREEPAHIHITILEPDGKYYWLNSYLFEGDSLLTRKHYNIENPRGGNSGIIALLNEGKFFSGRRDIILGKNIPDYE